jgi:hypothetical protein
LSCGFPNFATTSCFSTPIFRNSLTSFSVGKLSVTSFSGGRMSFILSGLTISFEQLVKATAAKMQANNFISLVPQ